MNTFYGGYPFPGRKNTGNKYHNQKTKIGDMVFDSKKRGKPLSRVETFRARRRNIRP